MTLNIPHEQEIDTSPAPTGSIDSTVPDSETPSSSTPHFPTNKRSLQHVPDEIQNKSAIKKKRLSEPRRIEIIADAISNILRCLHDDPKREGLRKTPVRYAKALIALTEGYKKSPQEVLGDAEFDENHTEQVLVRNIQLFSLCEHHLLPFHGVCHVAYIPSGSVIGLSKVARIVDVFARRFQVQERLTAQIADAIEVATKASGVMVYVSCAHMCMAMRGVQKVGSETSTTAARGRYKEDATLRAEFLTIVHGGRPGRLV